MLLDTPSSFIVKDIEELKEILFLILLPLYNSLPPPQDLGCFACRYLVFDSLYYFLFIYITDSQCHFLSSMKTAVVAL